VRLIWSSLVPEHGNLAKDRYRASADGIGLGSKVPIELVNRSAALRPS